MYKITFYLNDGEYTETVAHNASLFDIFKIVLDHIHERNPEWDWRHGTNGWADAFYNMSDHKTYIRVNGIGDVWKGQTYYILEKVK